MLSFVFPLRSHWFPALSRESLMKRKVRRVLVLARAGYIPYSTYGIRTCPRFWYEVFLRVHQEPPVNNADKRWDELFKIGFPLMRELDTLRKR